MKKQLIAYAAVFIAGGVLTSLMFNDAGTLEPSETVTVTVTETETVEVEVPAELNPACYEMLDAAETMADTASQVSVSQGEVDAILSEIRKREVQGDFYLLAQYKAMLNAATDNLSGIYTQLAIDTDRYNTAQEECNAERRLR